MIAERPRAFISPASHQPAGLIRLIAYHIRHDAFAFGCRFPSRDTPVSLRRRRYSQVRREASQIRSIYAFAAFSGLYFGITSITKMRLNSDGCRSHIMNTLQPW